MGCSSSLRCSPSSLRASSSSPGKRISFESRPCLRAFMRTAAFPSGVLGPVLLRAFWRLALACLSLVMYSTLLRYSCRWYQTDCMPSRTQIPPNVRFLVTSGRGRLKARPDSITSRFGSSFKGLRRIPPFVAIDGLLNVGQFLPVRSRGLVSTQVVSLNDTVGLFTEEQRSTRLSQGR